MRIYLRVVALMVIFAVSLSMQSVLASDRFHDRIVRFHADIHVTSAGMLEVTETIEIQTAVMNSRVRRGIYRDIPIRYRDAEGRPHHVDFEFLEVRRNGRPEPWFSERKGDFIRINTGNDHMLELRDMMGGQSLADRQHQTFELRYRTGRQLGHFETHDELYWNVTGNDWVFPILLASAEVTLPAVFDLDQLQLAFFTGKAGSQNQHAEVELSEQGVLHFTTTKAFEPREGLTILIGFPKGHVDEPTAKGMLEQFSITVDHLLFFAPHLLAILVASVSFIFLVVFGVMRNRLMRSRNDSEKGIIFVRYHPPENITPAELRDLKFSYDERCLSSDLLELARRGLLRISPPQRDDKSIGNTWVLEALSDVKAQELLPAPLKSLLKALFSKSQQISLSQEQSSLLRSVRKAHRDTLIGQQSGIRFYDYITLFSALAIALLSGVSGFWLLISEFAVDEIVWLHYLGIIAAGLTVLIALIYGFSSWHRFTPDGWRLSNHIDGFTRYLMVAEKSDLDRITLPSNEREPDLTPERFQQLLPYAVALDVANAWTQHFTAVVGVVTAEQTIKQMHWMPMRGDQTIRSFDNMTQGLFRDLDRSIRTTIKPPSTSSGFSSSGGGGFSGGGGGGGGGGGR